MRGTRLAGRRPKSRLCLMEWEGGNRCFLGLNEVGPVPTSSELPHWDSFRDRSPQGHAISRKPFVKKVAPELSGFHILLHSRCCTTLWSPAYS